MVKKTVGHVRLEWTCPRCGSKNPGPQKTCGSCGAPQPEDVKFEQPAQEKLVSDEEEIKRATAGPDVHCPYCDARNLAGAETCTQCGGDLTNATARAAGQVMGAHRDKAAKDVACPSCGAMNPATALKCSQCAASMAQPKPKPRVSKPARGPSCGPVAYFACAAALALIALFIFLVTRTSDVIGIVEAVSWTRTIAIEALGPATHDDWRDEIPTGAVVGTCTEKVHHTQDQPAPGAKDVCGTPYTEDTGTGYGEVVQDCQYEVYADWCKFTVQEWQKTDQVTLSGADPNPRWPDLQLGADQREGTRVEAHQIVFDTDGDTYTYQTSDSAEFSQYAIGSRWVLKVNQLNQLTSIEPAR